jgi:hypothetical protein
MWIRVLMAAAMLSGCSYSHLYGEEMRGVQIEQRHRVHVVRHSKDERAIDTMIARRLAQAGFSATLGPEAEGVPDGVDAVVSYEDHWMWDMSNYLLVLRIDFRDPETNELLASGQSYHTSLGRKSPDYMVNEIITEILTEK